jgi:hypothetical protein
MSHGEQISSHEHVYKSEWLPRLSSESTSANLSVQIYLNGTEEREIIYC